MYDFMWSNGEKRFDVVLVADNGCLNFCGSLICEDGVVVRAIVN